MFVTIISDCRDDNALGRQKTRVAALFESSVDAITTIGVSSELEAAGNLVDVLDAAGDARGIVLVNVAPRDDKAKTKGWSNGSPFGYFFVDERIIVISSIGEDTLSLVKKLGVVETVGVFDIPTVMEWAAIDVGLLTLEDMESVVASQFRSFEFAPLVALWIHNGWDPPMQLTDVADLVGEPSQMLWWVDCFGNCKTTLLYEDLGKITESAEMMNLLPFYPHLSDVPTGVLACTIGSSGFHEHRFLEIVLGGGNAAKYIEKYRRSDPNPSIIKDILELARTSIDDILERLCSPPP